MWAERERFFAREYWFEQQQQKNNDRRRELQFWVVEVSELTHYLVSVVAAQ